MITGFEHNIENIIQKLNTISLSWNSTANKWIFENAPDISQEEIYQIFVLDDRNFIFFLQRIKRLPSVAKCENCAKTLNKLYLDRNRYYFRCNTKNSDRAKISLFKGTVFFNSSLPPKRVFLLLYHFAIRRTNADTWQALNLSKQTVKPFFLFLEPLFVSLFKTTNLIFQAQWFSSYR